MTQVSTEKHSEHFFKDLNNNNHSWQTKARLIAFYLPQYHPIPENDQWWGVGFTEWTNVVKARPLFRGHYQPHLPADLGFYDLRIPEVRAAQATLAREYGIYGFCYYHYWFEGKRLLDRPFNEVLASGEPDFPFCLCWANENWTRTWDGRDKHVLIEQRYSEDDDRNHIRYLATVFQDNRYIRVHGRPLFLVYNASALPDPIRTTSIWREEAYRLGIGDLFLCKVESTKDKRVNPSTIGFDAAIEFQPDALRLATRWRRKLWALSQLLRVRKGAVVYDYGWYVRKMLCQPQRHYRYFPCVTPSWDNTARRKVGAFILRNSHPKIYEYWLRTTIENLKSQVPEENIVFINAWNEWAEGNHLEPCQKWGRAYLEATRRAVLSTTDHWM